MYRFKPPQSESHVHVNQLHKGQPLIPRQNKAITRTFLGREEIIDSSSAPALYNSEASHYVQKKNGSKILAEVNRPASRLRAKNSYKETAISFPEGKLEQKRPKSPLKPPNFYTVRLSNAPIFLRRTTLRPATLEFLNRRSPSPAERGNSRGPSRSRRHSPMKHEVFVPIKDDDCIAHSSIVAETEGRKNIEKTMVKLITESVQTGPLKKTHGTQMTPYDSETSDFGGSYFSLILSETPKKTIRTQTSRQADKAFVKEKHREIKSISDDSSLFIDVDNEDDVRIFNLNFS